jgi:hypothetical protein
MKRTRVIRVLVIVVSFSLLRQMALAESPDDKDVDPNIPQHQDVCENGVVSKKLLAVTLLVNAKKTHAIVRMSAGNEQWHTIFTDEHFCPAADTVCAKNPKGTACLEAQSCESDREDAINAGNEFFAALNLDQRKLKPAYKMSRDLGDKNKKSSDPFDGVADQKNLFFDTTKSASIACTPNKVATSAAPFDPSKDTSSLSKLRVRGLSDDLYVDRQNGNFKATSVAMGSFSDDTQSTHTASTKISGAFGYAYDSLPQAQIVPYVSLNQSLTDTQLKPRTIDPTNNVALGVQAERYFIDTDNPSISHVISFKPQYLFNTADQSQIASTRFIYAPWIDSPYFNLNTFRELDAATSLWGQIQFDVRNDSGIYTRRGNTPATALSDVDFDRAGFRTGLVLGTDNFPSLTLSLTETYLYGIAGFYRGIEVQQAQLTYNIVNSYFGLTASYKHGRDEDTAVASQIWTVGLTGRY